MVGLPDGEKNIEDMFTHRLHTIPDRRTDILPWHSPRYAYTSHTTFTTLNN